MDPLSLATRRAIATIFFALFAVVLVGTLVYATGYRLLGFSLERTGGVHISVAASDAEVSINGKSVGTSGFLTHSFFIDDLRPGSYEVSVVSEGYRPWKKTLIVEQSLVTDASAFLVPNDITLVPLVTVGDAAATTTRLVSKADYAGLLALFMATSSTPLATSTEEIKERKEPVSVLVRDGNVFVRWNRSLEQAPSSFCVTPQACVVEVTVENGPGEALHAEFFRDGVLYQLKGEGVYFAEVDVKSPQVVVPLAESARAEFYTVGGEVFIREGETLSVVSGL